ncbi:IQ domain-containing protein E isoform X2 [Cololabis saira]|uniref:IQ domain-containing protein E isoform X2 n=1 Tax=Cololabis saira TaxID=129043 RepID=UPI002AD25413|nr:IQ domain-containing protein E isoform X2 [Cololabis saira]
MCSASAKMSLEATDIQSDEDYEEELVEDGFSLPVDISEQRTRRNKSSGKPLSRSPYLSSLTVNSRRAPVGAWRLPRTSLGGTSGDGAEEAGSTRLTSLSNGHGFASSADDYRRKEDMYNEIIHLKKSLHAQKSDNQKIKTKLRRLQEENTKREKQIEELLDPSKGSEYTRSLVDKKKEGSVVLNGLKQRILKLEQQCREKENALSKLQSDLRTTNLEELKITAETYFEEIQRLKMLFEAAEKSSRAESKCSQRQQKALSSTVHRLSENLKQLQQENAALREELNTDSPAAGIKGYREWSKQRLLRRLLMVEKKFEDSSRNTQPAKNSIRLDKEIQATLTEFPGFTMATEAVVSVGIVTEEWKEVSDLRERLSQWEEERAGLQESLSSKDDELAKLRTEREEWQSERERWEAEQKKQSDEEKEQHKLELEQLWARIQTLEDDRSKVSQPKLSSPPPTITESHEHTQHRADQEEGEERDSGYKEKGAERDEELGIDAKMKERERAALIIQTHWRQHRQRDIVMLQSVFRGHFFRELQLNTLLTDMHHKVVNSHCCVVVNTVQGEVDVVSLTMIQSSFRAHLARCSLPVKSLQLSEPSLMENDPPKRAGLTPSPSGTGAESLSYDADKQDEHEDVCLVSNTCVSRMTHTPAPLLQPKPQSTAELDADSTVNSDDSDDIIVSPSRPHRRREVIML